MPEMDLSTGTGAGVFLHDIYAGTIAEKAKLSSVLLTRLKRKGTRDLVHGNQLVLEVKTGRGSGVLLEDNIDTAFAVPRPGSISAAKMYVATKTVVGTFGVPDVAPVRFRADGTAIGFTDPWKDAMDDVGDVMTDGINANLNSDGSGIRATISAYSLSNSTATFTVDSTRLLEMGMEIAINDSGSGYAQITTTETGAGAGNVITKIVSETQIIVSPYASPSATPASGDVIVLASPSGGSTYGKGVQGLQYIIGDTGECQGIGDRALNYWSQSSVAHNGTGNGTSVAFAKKKFLLHLMAMRRRSGVKPSWHMAQEELAEVIIWGLYPDFRFDNSNVLEAYDRGFTIKGQKLWVNDDMVDDAIYTVNESDLILAVHGKLIQPLKKFGASWVHPTLNTSGQRLTAYEASFVSYHLLASKRFDRHGVMDEISMLSDAAYGASGGSTA